MTDEKSNTTQSHMYVHRHPKLQTRRHADTTMEIMLPVRTVCLLSEVGAKIWERNSSGVWETDRQRDDVQGQSDGIGSLRSSFPKTSVL